MFKKVLVLFIPLMIGSYYGPILYNEGEMPSEKVEDIGSVAMVTKTEGEVHPLPASGFEHYVGQPVQVYVDRHGDPGHVYSEGSNGKTWWSYDGDLNKSLQLEVQDGVIHSLFVLGSNVQTGAIQIGMNRDNVYDETRLSRRFAFESSGAQYTLTLKRDELENFPLVQFDNDSFAMLFFHPETKEIYGIRYLSPQALLDLNYYHIEGREAVPLRDDVAPASLLLEHYVSVMRHENDLQPLAISEELKQYGTELVKTEGIQAVAFGNLSKEASDGKRVAYSLGDGINDPPLRFGLMFLEDSYRHLMLEPDYAAFATAMINGGVMLVFETKEVATGDH